MINHLTKKSGQSKYSSSYRFNNLDDFAVAVSNQPLEFEPGSMYIYGINQAILGKVIESATGVSFYEYLKKNILKNPFLNMKSTTFEQTMKKTFCPFSIYGLKIDASVTPFLGILSQSFKYFLAILSNSSMCVYV